MKRAKKFLAIMLAAMMVSSTIDYSGMVVVNAEENDVVTETAAETEAVAGTEVDTEIVAETEKATDTAMAIGAGTGTEAATLTVTASPEAGVTGSGTMADPYMVSTSDDLRQYLPKGYVKLANDIAITGYDISLYKYEEYTNTGIDLNGHVLDFSQMRGYNNSRTAEGILVRAAEGQNLNFRIDDSNPDSKHGGAYVRNDGTPITGGIITGFECDYSSGGVTSCILVDDADFVMTGGTFYKNKTHEGGTCIGVMGKSNVSISNTDFYNNECEYWSSGIWFGGSGTTLLEIVNCKFIDNMGYYTSVICSEATNTIIGNCVIQNNTSKRYGAVRVEGNGTATIKDTVITGNVNTETEEDPYAQTAGVYIQSYNSPQLILDGKVIITDNTINGEQRNLYCSIQSSTRRMTFYLSAILEALQTASPVMRQMANCM